MSREQLNEILKLIFEYSKIDDDKQQLMDRFTELFANSSHSPILDSSVDGMLKILNILDSYLEDWVWYFLYEAPSFYKRKGFVEVFIDDKGYKISSNDDAIEFILNNIYKYEKI